MMFCNVGVDCRVSPTLLRKKKVKKIIVEKSHIAYRNKDWGSFILYIEISSSFQHTKQ
jgi:hypothetical protein